MTGRSSIEDPAETSDLTDMLGELRVLLPGELLLSAFLITVPFNSGFGDIVHAEKQVFLVTFLLAIASLVLLSAPAVQHRLLRPLVDRVRFKQVATRQVIAGCVALSLALVLATQLVICEVFGNLEGFAAAAFVAMLILVFWWLLPGILRARGRL
ncbi:MAG: hypothetical protein K2Y16_07820 [Burkholderiales bacterium]|nr:hypothetical protein [Burkholderiales bacterium]